MPQEPIDPSWVPATVATCTATLVAIVGGVVGSRRVQNASEDRQAAATVTALTKAVADAQEAAGKAHRALVAAEANLWLAQMIGHLVSLNRQGMVVDALLRDTPTAHLPSIRDASALQPHLDDVMARITAARTDVQSFYHRDPIIIDPDWELASRSLDVGKQEPRDSLTVIIYCHVFAAIYAAWAAANPLLNDDGRPRAGERGELVRPPRIRNADELEHPTAVVERSQESTKTLMHEEAVAVRRLDEAKSRLSLAQVHRDALAARPSDRRLFIILATLGLVGVAAPLGVLANGIKTVPHAVNYAWVAIVGVGILAVLVTLSGTTVKAALKLTFVPLEKGPAGKRGRDGAGDHSDGNSDPPAGTAAKPPGDESSRPGAGTNTPASGSPGGTGLP